MYTPTMSAIIVKRLSVASSDFGLYDIQEFRDMDNIQYSCILCTRTTYVVR